MPITAESTLAEVRQHLADTARQAVELRTRPADQRGDTYEGDLRSLIDEISFGDTIERALAAAERGQRAADEDAQRQRSGPRGAFAGGDDEQRTAGQEFTETEEYKAWVEGGQRGVHQSEVRTLLFSETTGTGAGLWRPVGTPVLNYERRRRAFVRDLMGGAQGTGLSSVPYLQEVDVVTNETGANVTSEGSAKNEVTMEFQQQDAPVRKITAWLPVTTEILADAPTLRGYIDRRLEYMIMIREEQQILNGTGTAPQIRGILQTTGVQTQAAVNNDVPATLGAAFGLVENVDGDPNGVVMNPTDYWAAITTRHTTQFDSGFGGNAPAVVSGISWGEPVVRTRALSSLDAIVGDWRLGATLFQREGVMIKTGEQHSDFFTTNKVAIVAEERIALAVDVPAFFVDVTLDITA